MDAWLALLDTDLIATLCIVFMIHLLLRPPTFVISLPPPYRTVYQVSETLSSQAKGSDNFSTGA